MAIDEDREAVCRPGRTTRLSAVFKAVFADLRRGVAFVPAHNLIAILSHINNIDAMANVTHVSVVNKVVELAVKFRLNLNEFINWRA